MTTKINKVKFVRLFVKGQTKMMIL